MHGHKYKFGDKVKFADHALHRGCPQVFPPGGTIGTVLAVDKTRSGAVSLYVQWAEGSTSQDDRWWALDYDVEPFEGESK